VANPPARRRDLRWRAAAELLRLVRREPGVTRAAAAARLHLSSGSATEITTRLRAVALLDEAPVPVTGRGRPTRALVPHPQGPVVVAVDLRHADWRYAVADLGGVVETAAPRRHRDVRPDAVVTDIRGAIAAAHDRFGARLRAVSVAVAGTVRDGRLVQAATLGWGPVDLAALGTPAPHAAVVIGNDATLAAVAEARSGAAAAAQVALHLTVEVGVGGALVVGGRPQDGGTGAGGEFGHLPFGDRELTCPCGARGCWDVAVDGRALARRLGAPPPADARSYAGQVLARAAGGDDTALRTAIGEVTAAFGAGVAGLVNALDPDVVTVGGLAIPLRDAAPAEFDRAYLAGLMGFRRADPTPVLDAAHGDEGALRGAVEVGLDAVLSEAALSGWAADREAATPAAAAAPRG
jgi:predicted NBD/HSP70 family sugar kinase